MKINLHVTTHNYFLDEIEIFIIIINLIVPPVLAVCFRTELIVFSAAGFFFLTAVR